MGAAELSNCRVLESCESCGQLTLAGRVQTDSPVCEYEQLALAGITRPDMPEA